MAGDGPSLMNHSEDSVVVTPPPAKDCTFQSLPPRPAGARLGNFQEWFFTNNLTTHTSFKIPRIVDEDPALSTISCASLHNPMLWD